MKQEYEGSCIIYPLDKAFNGSVTIDATKYYATVVSTGREKPSHRLFLENAGNGEICGTALFRNDPGKKSLISGSIVMFQNYWVDIYLNKSKDDRPDFLTLKFTNKADKQAKPKYGPPTEQQPLIQEPQTTQPKEGIADLI